MNTIRGGYVYMITNTHKTTIYIGVTNNIRRRTHEHKSGVGGKFSKKYNLHCLVYYEYFNSIREAIRREKQMKSWKRAWKENKITEINPDWEDLAADWYDDL